MIPLTDVAAEMVAGYSYQVHCRLQSWFGGEVVAEDIPVMDVNEECDASLRVPERLTFQVPVVDEQGYSWVPTEYDSPLACYGQTIVGQIGISLGSENVEWVTRGTFLVESAETAGNTISVECVGLMQLLDEAGLPNEYQPKAGATLKSILRAMIEPGITIDFDPTLVDRTSPSASITWSDNRLDNVYGVLDAWPARLRVTSEGFIEVLPEYPDTLADPVLALHDGELGTAMEFNTNITRDGSFNAVVAKGTYPDSAGTLAGQEIVATAYDDLANSPFRIGGPFSPYLVPFGYASPLMTTPAMVQKAADTRLKTLRRRASRTITVSAVPHPGLELGDVVSVSSERLGLSETLGRIETISLPYQPDGGGMLVTVRLVA